MKAVVDLIFGYLFFLMAFVFVAYDKPGWHCFLAAFFACAACIVLERPIKRTSGERPGGHGE